MTDVAAGSEKTYEKYLLYATLKEQTALSRLTLDLYVNQAIHRGLLQMSQNYRAVEFPPKGLAYLAEKRIIET